MRKLCVVPGGIDAVIKALEEHTGVPMDYDAVRRTQHGLKFVRGGLHIWHRARSMVCLEDIVLCRQGYGCDNLTQCVAALSDELRAGGDLMTILATDPPAEFAALFTPKTE